MGITPLGGELSEAGPKTPRMRAISMLAAAAIALATVVGPGAVTAEAATWVGCSFMDTTTKKVRTFNRAAGSDMSAGKAVLACGSQGWDTESGWGFRHIRYRHEGDWAKISTMTGGSWQGVADWAMNDALSSPAYVTYRKTNDTYAYTTQIHLRDRNGQVRHSYYVTVSVARVSKNIITAFPSEK